MKGETLVFYALLAISALIAAASLLTLNVFVVAIAAFAIMVTVIVYKLWYVIDSLIFKHTNIVEVFNGYELSRDRNSAIRRVDDKISSTTAAILSVGKESEVEKQQIENIVAHINYPFKFIMQVERLNVNKITDRLQTGRSMKEIELSRLQGSSKKQDLKVGQIKRELELIQHDIDAINTGEAPVRLIYYILTSAMSETFYDAEERAKSQIRELASQFDALLSSKSKILTGNELLSLLQIDSEMVLG